MTERRVVVTGVGLTTPIGTSVEEVSSSLREGRSGIARIEEWADLESLRTALAGAVPGPDLSRYPRKQIRSMGRVAHLALHATEAALADAGIAADSLRDGTVGLAYGSTHGSTSAMEEYGRTLFLDRTTKGLVSTTYLKFMSHTCAANLAQFYGIRGRVAPTCSACTSASQAIGTGYELIRGGRQDVMICGGAEELHFSHAVVFDVMYATSTRFNEQPSRTPRPFDVDRDGLVVAEGAGTLILEDLARARRRGATIHAELIGYGSNCDGGHVTSPSVDGMAAVMQLALADAALAPDAIEYLNAHGTGTEVGDIAESLATQRALGERVPISSTKSFTGHTLGACGAIEAIFCLAMMRDGFLAPTRTFETRDPRCAPLDYIQGDARSARPRVAMSNNFAFGGINTSLVFRTV